MQIETILQTDGSNHLLGFDNLPHISYFNQWTPQILRYTYYTWECMEWTNKILYFLHSTSVLSSYIDVVVTLSILHVIRHVLAIIKGNVVSHERYLSHCVVGNVPWDIDGLLKNEILLIDEWSTCSATWGTKKPNQCKTIPTREQ